MRKLTRKLFLSIFTLAICAVTLVSTTFAWFTSNEVVTADQIKAGATTATGSTLMVQQYDYNITNSDNTKGNWINEWTNSITFNTDMSSLKPVEYDPYNNKFSDLGGGSVTRGTDYLEFKLRFKTTSTDNKSIDVYFSKFELKSSGAQYYDNLIYENGKTTGGLNDKQYILDVLKATDMVIIANGITTVYELDGYAQTDDEGIHKADAVTYYNTVMKPEKNIEDPKFIDDADATHVFKQLEDEKESMSKVFTIPYETSTDENGNDTSSYKVVEVTILIYLNGWDEYCYDACKGQKFTLDVEFSTTQPKKSTDTPEQGEGA